MISSIISRLVILVFGTLYPAYASYKAVRTKNLKEYVKWMMYWIVFALFTCTETITDVFLSWFPFYYEVKIVLVLWLLSPATKGSSILYRKFVHPALCRREQEIDEYIAKAKDQGYHTVLNLGTKGVNYATTVIMQTAIKGGGGLVQQLRKSYSLSDLTECEPREERSADEADDVMGEPRRLRPAVKSGYNTRRSASKSNSRSPLYFPEVDVDVRTAGGTPDFGHIKSSEDISSGYSSADNSSCLSRTASVGARSRAKTTRTTVTTIKRPQAAEGSEVIIEELHDDDHFDYANMPPLVNLPSPLYMSHTTPPFIYQYVGDQIQIVQVVGNSPLIEHVDNNDVIFPNKNTVEIKETIEEKSVNDSKVKEVVVNPKDNEDTRVEKVDEFVPLEKEVVIVDNKDKVVIKETNEENSVNVFKVEEVSVNPKDTEGASKVPSSNDQIPNDSENKTIINSEPIAGVQEKKDSLHETVEVISNANKSDKVISNVHKPIEVISNVNKPIEVNNNEQIETTSIDTSNYDNDSAESDDEASFGTPEDSPKTKRKSPKGKYGKGKAPSPPKLNKPEVKITNSNTVKKETLTDMVNKLPEHAFKDSGSQRKSHLVNPICEHKKRNHSRSPCNRTQRSSSSGLGKLLALPSKLAFWNKGDEKSKTDTISNSSGEYSRRSSTLTIDTTNEDFEICPEMDNTEDKMLVNSEREIAEDQISFKDADDFESELMSQVVMEKSDALQKLIDAKLESHPEYKFVSLHTDHATTSKSTDV